MDGKTRMKIILAVPCAISLAVLISYAQGTIDFTLILANSLVFASSFSVIAIIHSRHMQKSKLDGDISDVMSGLGKALYYESSNISLSRSLRKASESDKNPYTSKMLRLASMRIELGESFYDAMYNASSGSSGLQEKLRRYIKNPESGIGEAPRLYQSHRRSEAYRSNALASRYATLSMFVSTLAPSFVIFSFVGGMLISQSYSSTEFMSILLVSAVPVTYSIIKSIAKRPIY